MKEQVNLLSVLQWFGLQEFSRTFSNAFEHKACSTVTVYMVTFDLVNNPQPNLVQISYPRPTTCTNYLVWELGKMQ